MKRFFTIIILFILSIILTSCFGTSTRFPDMVEYSEQEVLEVAKEKYNIQKFYYTGVDARKSYNPVEGFSYSNYTCNGIFTNIKNPDNLEKALTSFAGKNGGHDIQGMFRYFACYIALGEDINGVAKFIYYNTNINKNEKIVDTIGSSDYPYDLHPSEINTKFMDEITMDSLRINFKKQYHDEISIKGILYCFDTPTIVTGLNNRYYKYLVQFYKEEDKAVFDIYRITVSDEYNYDAISQNITSKELIYSTSNKYEIYFAKYGVNPSDFFDINFTVEQSTEANYLDLISVTITVKDVGKEVINYSFNYKISYKVKDEDGKLIDREHTCGYTELNNSRYGLLIDKIDGHDHKQSTNVTISYFYIIYKNSD